MPDTQDYNRLRQQMINGTGFTQLGDKFTLEEQMARQNNNLRQATLAQGMTTEMGLSNAFQSHIDDRNAGIKKLAQSSKELLG